MVSARTQTLVQLNEELLELLDRGAAARGVSRSALIRELVREGLGAERSRVLDEQMARGYGDAPQAGARDEWGDLDRFTEVNARRNLAALAEEESEPW